MFLKVGTVAKRFGLSRSALLYYDRAGLLKPSGRSFSNYRLYTQEDCVRLEKICLYRQAGLGVEEIKKIFISSNRSEVDVLENKLGELNRQIGTIRRQQKLIVEILSRVCSKKIPGRIVDKQTWVEMLSLAGMDDKAMYRWHAEFECLSPLGHQDFLESLGIGDDEISEIREFSRNTKQKMEENNEFNDQTGND